MTPAAALLERLARYRRHNRARSAGEDFVSVGLAVLALAIRKLPAAERDDGDGSPLMDVTHRT
jgi:hypothetical protein